MDFNGLYTNGVEEGDEVSGFADQGFVGEGYVASLDIRTERAVLRGRVKRSCQTIKSNASRQLAQQTEVFTSTRCPGSNSALLRRSTSSKKGHYTIVP